MPYHMGNDRNVPMYRSRAHKREVDESLSAWLAIPAPPSILDEQGNCRQLRDTNPEEASYFFLDVPNRKKDAIAKSYCKGCPVLDECFNYAIRLPWGVDFGVWGGTNRNERKAIRNGNK